MIKSTSSSASTAKERESARQLIQNPAFAAPLVARRITQDSDSPGAAIRQTNSVLRSVVLDLSALFAAIQQTTETARSAKNKDQVADRIQSIEHQVKQLKAEITKLDEIMAKIDDLLPKMMAALGDEGKDTCQLKPGMVELRTAELLRMVARIEAASAASRPPAELELFVSKLRPIVEAAPVLYRHHIAR